MAVCIKTVLESRLEVLDKDLAKLLLDKYQYETTAQERKEAIVNSNDLVNNIELKTLEGKVVYCWKDELTKQAEKADLTEVEMEIFKLVKNAGSSGAKQTWMKERLQVNTKIVSQSLRMLQRYELIVEEKIGKVKYFRTPDVSLDEAITGGFWQKDDDLTFDEEAIDAGRRLVGMCLASRIEEKKRSDEKGILFGESVGCYVRDVAEFINNKKVMIECPKEKDVKLILECMRYDDLVGCVQDARGEEVYYLNRNLYPENMGFSSTPCGGCPVRGVCREDGNINPNDCEYFAEWLEK